MDVLFIGKRFYTNRDAYNEKFGRIYQIPHYISQKKTTHLWLIDYHTRNINRSSDQQLEITTTPVFSLMFLYMIFKMIFKRPKLIIASGDCYIGLLSLILSKITRSKFIFDVYDKYDTFSGYRNLFGINLYQLLLKKSDMCLFPSLKLLNDTKDICKKTFFVPNGIDENLFHPKDKSLARQTFNLKNGDLYIGYFGSMEIERGIDDLIQATKLVRKIGIDLKILIGGTKRLDLNLDDAFIHYLGNIPFNTVSTAMSCCDLLALPYRKSSLMDHGSSCKIAEYLALQIPIVSTNSTNFSSNFNLSKNDISILSECSDPDSFAQAILHQLKNPHYFIAKDDRTWISINRQLYTMLFKEE
ncbi:glycosyltransferase [Acinetobacter tianfuensis]|uniref:Glycosyltransferase n=1 Tax=Acinetobacter tianfuensis TaxID=2419603 RepID=A0A3A8EAA1_9GAMM|nr:glycosyltransferase [Acinetobacter tianfuensis]RKG31605.1 glycosyltransferase [Acinetobacter tianfuensis]